MEEYFRLGNSFIGFETLYFQFATKQRVPMDEKPPEKEKKEQIQFVCVIFTRKQKNYAQNV